MTISVIIPVYNEEATIAEVVQQVARVPFNTEIIVVDDGSTDATPRILRDGVRAEVDCLCTLPRNRGKGAAIREGLRHATGDIVLIQDADLELLPEDYPQLLAPLFRGTARVVYGSRFLRGRGGARWLTYFTNRALTWWANLLFGTHLTDVAAGYKVFRAQVLRDLPLQAEGFEFCPEVTARLLR
ncbi:MAG TPA: glycosyltransferase family 2 protein, partial [Armatimonadetes bacterium]|nr:glycosyltransferase family 2 protein [Armatimonadota bacterium]